MSIFSLYWIPFFIGLAVHVLLQAEASSKSKSNGLHNVAGWLEVTWPIVVGRCFFCSLSMAVWLEMPNVFSKMVSVATGGAAGSLPLNAATAGLFGYLIDSFLDKISVIVGIKIDIPEVVPPTN